MEDEMKKQKLNLYAANGKCWFKECRKTINQIIKSATKSELNTLIKLELEESIKKTIQNRLRNAFIWE
jgi:hypothetical protein